MWIWVHVDLNQAALGMIKGQENPKWAFKIHILFLLSPSYFLSQMQPEMNPNEAANLSLKRLSKFSRQANPCGHISPSRGGQTQPKGPQNHNLKHLMCSLYKPPLSGAQTVWLTVWLGQRVDQRQFWPTQLGSMSNMHQLMFGETTSVRSPPLLPKDGCKFKAKKMGLYKRGIEA